MKSNMLISRFGRTGVRQEMTNSRLTTTQSGKLTVTYNGQHGSGIASAFGMVRYDAACHGKTLFVFAASRDRLYRTGSKDLSTSFTAQMTTRAIMAMNGPDWLGGHVR